jgi:shikimate dehydrogenase
MQNAAIAALGLNWRYLAFEVHPDNLRLALDGAKAMRFVGINLTVPHKLLAVKMVDVLDASAETWGAVNTVRFETKDKDGTWRSVAEVKDESQEVRSHGFNTDADAIVQALRDELGLRISGSRVLLLGAGGAGRTAGLKLASESPAHLFIVNRTRAKADELCREIKDRFPAVQTTVGYPAGEVDLLLNATSLGLKPTDPIPLEEHSFALNKAGAVYDMIYRPAETALLQAAKRAGCKTANGLGMLLYQGAKALELWCHRPVPIEVMRKALEKNVYG